MKYSSRTGIDATALPLRARQFPRWRVSGLARISRDRQTIHALYAEDWRIWFPNEGDPRHGTPDDPRMVLIGVDVHAAVFLEVDKPQPVVLYEMAKGWLTGADPDIGTMHHLKDAHR